jgi:hypothetical protein
MNNNMNNNNIFQNMINNNNICQSMNNNINNNNINPNMNNNNIIQNMNNNMINNIINKIDNNNNNINVNNCLNPINPIKALLYCLSNVENLTSYLLNNNNYNEHQNYKDIFPITSEYSKIIYDLFNNRNQRNIKEISITQNFKDLIMKNNISSPEPKNIFNFILENIHDENKVPIENQNYNNQMKAGKRDIIFNNFIEQKFNPENTSNISNNFFGIEEILKCCSKCNNSFYKYEIFKYIEFDIKEINNSMINKVNELLDNSNNDNNN